MPATVDTLSSETGLSADLVHKGLGAILDFLRQHLGQETFDRIQAAIPGATDLLHRFESSPEGDGGGGLIGALTGLASKVLGGAAGDTTRLLESFARLGFKPEQIEAFLPRALEFLRSHLPADLVEQVLSKFPALAEFTRAQPE